MKLKKFGFLHHYRKIKIEGTNLSNVVNKCIQEDIDIKDLTCRDRLESTATIRGEDFDRMKRLAGHSYRLTVLTEGGAVPFFKSIKTRITVFAGAFLLGAFLFYQSIFVAEIRIDGCRSISEESLRTTLARAGLYEGARKPESYEDVKKAVYSEFDDITWISIYEEGRLVEIEIAQANDSKFPPKEDRRPVSIVAARSGMIEKILPYKGNACVQKGDYVNKGDVLISGAYEYQSTDYSKGDDVKTLYSHAEGQVLAKAPVHLTYYVEKNQRIRKATGRAIPGLYIRLGNWELDTASWFKGYEVSERKEKKLLELVKPLPLKVSLVAVKEINIEEKHRNMEDVQAVVEAAVRQYGRDELSEGEEITGSSIDYSESQGVIKAGVLLEVLEDIGVESPIDMKNEEKEEKHNINSTGAAE